MWNTETDTEERFRNKAIWGSAAAVVLIAVGAFVYFKYYANPAPAPVVATAAKPAAAGNVPPAIQNPVPPPAEAKPLPPLNESDQVAHDVLGIEKRIDRLRAIQSGQRVADLLIALVQRR